jgi:hypothetical protein
VITIRWLKPLEVHAIKSEEAAHATKPQKTVRSLRECDDVVRRALLTGPYLVDYPREARLWKLTVCQA